MQRNYPNIKEVRLTSEIQTQQFLIRTRLRSQLLPTLNPIDDDMVKTINGHTRHIKKNGYRTFKHDELLHPRKREHFFSEGGKYCGDAVIAVCQSITLDRVAVDFAYIYHVFCDNKIIPILEFFE